MPTERVIMEVRVPRDLRTRARLLAVERETSLRQVVTEALERLLAAEETARDQGGAVAR